MTIPQSRLRRASPLYTRGPWISYKLCLPCVKGGGFCGAKDEGIVKLNDNVDRYLKNLISQSPVTVDRPRQRKANLCLSKIQRTVTPF